MSVMEFFDTPLAFMALCGLASLAFVVLMLGIAHALGCDVLEDE